MPGFKELGALHFEEKAKLIKVDKTYFQSNHFFLKYSWHTIL